MSKEKEKEKVKLTCTVCPKGCEIKVTLKEGKITDISGNKCKRGEKYAKAEVSDPRRTLTTTMRVAGGGLVSVKSADTLPKGKLKACMKEINAAEAKAPVMIGDVLIKDILGLGVDIVATSRITVV
jgi:CxxC motif-containing protein